MTLPYNQIIEDNILKLVIYQHKFLTNIPTLHYKPSFISNKGEIIYSGNNHINSNLYAVVEHSIRRFFELDNVKTLSTEIPSRILVHKTPKYTSVDNIDLLHFRNYINRMPPEWMIDDEIPYWDNCKGYYSEDIFNYINSVISVNNEIANHFISLDKLLVDVRILFDTLLKLKKIDISSIKEPNYNYMMLEDNMNSKLYEALYILVNDYIVQIIGFDKIETSYNKTITTSKNNIYEYFFNYLLMNYSVYRIPKIYYNIKENLFEERYFMGRPEDAIFKREIELIRKHVKLEDRHKYFI